MTFTTNQVMEWSGIGGGRLSDHNRTEIQEQTERIERKARMVNGTLRRYVTAKKRTWSTSWSNLPSKNGVSGFPGTFDGGMSGEQLEAFHKANDGVFRMIIRKGSAVNKSAPVPPNGDLPYQNADFVICNVMISEFSKDIVKRGPGIDWWNLSVTVEEV